jgi:capsular polysaccharide biosynthesis protein
VASTRLPDDRRDGAGYLGLGEILYVLEGRLRVVLVVVLVLILAVVSFVVVRGPVYEAEAIVSVRPTQEVASGEGMADFLQGVSNAVGPDEMREKVMRQVGYEGRRADFGRRLEVEPFVAQDGGGRIRVRYRGPDPDESARVANAYAELFVAEVDRLNDNRLAGGSLPAEAGLESRAVPSMIYSGLRFALYMLGAVAAGLLIGGAAAFFLEGRGSSWRGARDAELTLGVPVLGVIPERPVGER